jgi:phosphatidylserine/phosphatidylglycerophosphate/cardiolipin synthase-like enzyme
MVLVLFGCAENISEENTNTIVLFCPRDDCGKNLIYLINQSEEVKCALFDVDVDEIISILKRKNASVVVDNINYDQRLNFTIKDTKFQYMHNKFCVFDSSTVWTGSFNPTHRGDSVNNNNVVIVESKLLAENYLKEFDELQAGVYGGGLKTKRSKNILNGKLYENYFCPEDWCANRIIDVLDSAEKSIHFMVFSFTHRKVAEVLIDKAKQIEVKGVMEKSQNSRYSQFDIMNKSLDVKWDNNGANMHHKVFIVDGKVVVIGSFNPSINGDVNNDENVLIIHDSVIATKFEDEFDFILNSSQNG